MTADTAPSRRGWRESLRVYIQPPVRPLLFLGFSSGLPFLLVFSTLSAWLAQAHVSRSTIGYFSWAGLAYSFKYFWAPIVDRTPLPLLSRLGRRRSWMLLAQIGIAVALIGLALGDPEVRLQHTALLAVCLAFASATQDIAVDAYRIEAAPADLQGALAAAYQIGYRIAMIAAGAGALFVAAGFGWHAAYLTMAALTAIGMATTLLIREPRATLDRTARADEARVTDFLVRSSHWPHWARQAAAWFIGAVVCPFTDIFMRFGIRRALAILAFVACYRASDFTMGVMANPFYLDLGFTLEQIAGVSKIYGVLMTTLGVVVAGLLVARRGFRSTLLVGAAIVCIANLYFSILARSNFDLFGLILAISLDNIGIGIAGTAFVAYLSNLVNPTYTATQYALLGMAWSLPCKLLAGFSGRVVDSVGYPLFFVYTATLSLLAIFMLLRVKGLFPVGDWAKADRAPPGA
jgi:PAT family beta-lactamase induction signal transducer AmpG